MDILVTFLMYLFSALAIVGIVMMLLRKMDIKITLFLTGMILIMIGMLLKGIVGENPIKVPSDVLKPIQVIVQQFKTTLPAAGFIILILGGYTAYMSHIGANEVTVNTLLKPLKIVKSPYILVPIMFLIGNLLSLVIPSASNLAIILLATLLPVLRKAGMSTLTAAAVIATTATVMPTPLGADNIAIAQELGIPVTNYVFQYHAIISIPTLFLMAVAHYFWQKHCDKKAIQEGSISELEVHASEIKEVRGGALYKTVYTILPLLPILLLLLIYFINIPIKAMAGEKAEIALTVELASIISFIIAIICEMVRKRNAKEVLSETEVFFKGMGSAIGIVALLVAAGVFVEGLKYIGVIQHLQDMMAGASVPGFVLPLIMVGLTAVIVLLSGSGTALFYAMIPLMVPLATAAGISPLALSIPMGLAGNLLRAVSPVSAVIVIVAASTKENPIKIVKRTAIPMVLGVIFMFVLSMVLFLTGALHL